MAEPDNGCYTRFSYLVKSVSIYIFYFALVYDVIMDFGSQLAAYFIKKYFWLEVLMWYLHVISVG